ncbi:hypothetical protein BJY24_003623 [Nocardia transvalensis]|uniref:Barstar (barnase inhibitor) domain-containing protein n=1 Tax=Nocardia transvalensis TaxID=37333 RepID=A0A7W9PEL7_9NOCA|nr:barstar family protein [Nocardia transvalensis]MBB5914756.1 hypothetical protein [Nocardia transvalensis]
MTTSTRLKQFLSGPVEAASGGPAGRGNGGDVPVLGALPVDNAEFSGVRYQAPEGYVVRELRGDRMRTVAGLYDEFAAAFQFPYYFGENKDAFDECLRDLDDFVGRAPGYVVAIRDADQVLADQPDQRDWFTEAMRDNARYWSVRDTVFRVVLQDKPAGEAVALTL